MHIRFLILLMVWALSQTVPAQDIKGNVFYEQSSSSNDSTLTKYTWVSRDGKTYPIWLSPKGKAYVRINQKEKAKGRRYLPEVGKQINPKAYTNENKRNL